MMNSTRALPYDKLAVGAALVIGLGAILAALVSEHVFGLLPCVLCLEQRLAYYIGLPILALVLVAWNRLPLAIWSVLIAVCIGLFAYNGWLGVYHAGVEWAWWAGPQSCTGVGEAISFDALSDLNAARVVPCDQVQFRFLGLSMAGYNALISAGIVVLLTGAGLFQWRRGRQVDAKA